MVHQKDFKGLVLGGEIDLSFGVYEVPVVVSLECGRELRERCGWYFVEVYCFGLVNGFGFELFDPARCRFVGIDKYMLGSFGGFVEAFSAWATDFDPEVAAPVKSSTKSAGSSGWARPALDIERPSWRLSA